MLEVAQMAAGANTADNSSPPYSRNARNEAAQASWLCVCLSTERSQNSNALRRASNLGPLHVRKVFLGNGVLEIE
eukprot:CAMPEP_0115613010 /NCGR_PEP_ID=MMETSP0272-20121206/21357_1 /TAXON_ID=71861 /ORGANISM="Scrippsiella trochoidea, Strain CCMP3099" /LENGTH=74 /DNA_ID=CAMNT_0003048819 /DNA_START=522 /DNA_END=743 /DNA_ORIENTATION=+